MPATNFGRDQIPQWPDVRIPPNVKETVESFYRLVDTESEEAFQGWTDLFTADGLIEIGKKRVQGHADLLQERRASWNKIRDRNHHLYRVYTIGPACTDLIAIGRVDIECRNGVKFSQEFAQNFLIQQRESGGYEIQKFQAWIDSEPLKTALAE